MSATTPITSTPVIEALMAAISCLSREEQATLLQQVQGKMDQEEDFPQWQMDIVEEREKLWRAGLVKPVPLEEGLRQVGERLRARGIRAE
jgi:hypothetical protein